MISKHEALTDEMIRSHPRDPQQHSILKLPNEIRNQIYDLVLVAGKPIYVATNQIPKAKTDMYISIEPEHTSLTATSQPGLSLLQTCRQIHLESSSRFYRNDQIVVSALRQAKVAPNSIGTASKWLQTIGTQIQYTNRLEIDFNAFLNCISRKCHLPAFTWIHDRDYVDVTSWMHILRRNSHLVVQIVTTTLRLRKYWDYEGPEEPDCDALTPAISALQHDDGISKIRRAITLLGLHWVMSKQGVSCSLRRLRSTRTNLTASCTPPILIVLINSR